jgi:hypothetical protein
VTLNPACASARNLADDSVCRNGVKMPEAEVKRRIAVIEDAMSKGRLQKDVVDELDWTRGALIKFMRRNKMPNWEKTSNVVLEFMADIKENGQNNRTQQEISEQTGIPVCTVRAAVTRLKRDDDGFVWENGGVMQKTLIAREIFDGAIKDGTVRASRRSPGRRMLSAAESCSRIRTPASPSPFVFVDSSLGCSSWTIGRIVYL